MTSTLALTLPADRGARLTLPPPAASVEASRERLLSAIGAAPDLTFVRGVGNRGDELIAAGTRQLLAGRSFREIALLDLPGASGHTAVLSGSGAWCRPYHELMPYQLPLAELHFKRVIVLPSSFDVRVAAVREALMRTRATVFARELESYEQLREVCGGTVELAHDCAFFYDLTLYAAHAARGRGVLAAFRGDAEAIGPPPAGSNDISVTCTSLDHWLWTIASHEVVQTDRAHVMIAAARLGKRVEYRPSSYHKVPAIAAWCLGGYDVRPLPVVVPRRMLASDDDPAVTIENVRARLAAQAAVQLSRLPPPPPLAASVGAGAPRLTVVLLTLDRTDYWPRLLGSIRATVRTPYRLLILDNGSAPAARAELERLCAALFPAAAPGSPAVEICWLEQNLGCAGGRRHATARVTTEYLLFVDDDAELFAGAVDHLVAELDRDPAVAAAGAHVVLPDGHTQLCGGRHWIEAGGVLHSEPLDQGKVFENLASVEAQSCDWLAGATVAFRVAALQRDPIDDAFGAYYEDTEWFFRVGRTRPEAVFRRVPAALVLHYQELKGPRGRDDDEVERSLPFLAAILRFYRAYGLLLDGVFVFAPLLAGHGRRDPAAARLLLELLEARGPRWLAATWKSGDLAPLFRLGLGVQLPLPAVPDHGGGGAAGVPAPQRAGGAAGVGGMAALGGMGGAAGDEAAAVAAAGAARAEREAAAPVLRDKLAATRADLAMHERELAEVRRDLVAARHHGDDLRGRLAAAEDQLVAVRRTRIWQVALWYWRLRDRLAGRGAAAAGGGRRDGEA